MIGKSWSFSEFPEDFQKEPLLNISDILKKGESVQLVGAPGAGTSSIIKLISQAPKIKDRYFPQKLGFKFLVFDAGSLLERNSLTASRLLLTLFGPQVEIPPDNVSINEKLAENIDLICTNGRIVLAIDHIQEFDYPEFKPFFTNLTYLYRKFRPRICFLSASVKPLVNARDLLNFGDFGRVLINNVIYIPLLNKKDGAWFINDVAEQVGISLQTKEVERVYIITLGFPRTMKKIVEAMGRGYSVDEIIENPGLDPALALHLGELKNTGDFVKESPIMSSYETIFIGNEGESIGNLKFQTKLTKLEERLLKLFLSKTGEIISREEGINFLWGSKAIGISEHAYDQIFHRLRGKLADAKPKVDLKTVRGRGHVLKIAE